MRIRDFGVDYRHHTWGEILISKTMFASVSVIELITSHLESVTGPSIFRVFNHAVPTGMFVAANVDVISDAKHNRFRRSVSWVILGMTGKVVTSINAAKVLIRKIKLQTNFRGRVGCLLPFHKPLDWIAISAPAIMIPADAIQPLRRLNEPFHQLPHLFRAGGLLRPQRCEPSRPIIRRVSHVRAEQPFSLLDRPDKAIPTDRAASA